MYKPLEYSSLHNMVEDYEQAYTNCGHNLVKVNSTFREDGKIYELCNFASGKLFKIITDEKVTFPNSWVGVDLSETMEISILLFFNLVTSLLSETDNYTVTT